jgi:histidyl-tRNA synthetase
MITPRTLQGFRDYLPEAMIPREWIMETARRVYRSFGFRPIDTPALEYLEILTGKGSEETDKQLYHFTDQGGRAVGLRFDLTVPLARFVAQYAPQLGTPFKRYHIAAVWRGERPQAGRYREFMQCDFDTVGTTSLTSDIEMTVVVHDLLRALEIERFAIHVNHRGVLNGLLEKLGLADRSTAVLRALDKIDKLGPERVREELAETASATGEQTAALLRLAALDGSNEDVLQAIEPLVAGSDRGEQGVAQLRELLGAASAAGVPAACLRLNPAIARGLDYYTGLVVETVLDDLPQIGSVCSGGRYDDLASLYGKQQLPGVGASLGIDRLLAALEQLGKLPAARAVAPVLVCQFVAARRDDYLRLAGQLRAAGVGAEVYPEPKKLGKQLQYADRLGFRSALVLGEDEFAAGQCQIKDLAAGTSTVVAYRPEAPEELLAALRER